MKLSKLDNNSLHILICYPQHCYLVNGDSSLSVISCLPWVSSASGTLAILHFLSSAALGVFRFRNIVGSGTSLGSGDFRNAGPA